MGEACAGRRVERDRQHRRHGWIRSGLDLNARLLAAGYSLRALREAQAPEAADLVARLKALPALAKTDPAAAAASLDGLKSESGRSRQRWTGWRAASCRTPSN